ncbi:MAG: hypothetical protein QOE74_4814 [Mycobacterium sp.]|jgi:hypothetical protein|nr:hypothetical protein [Mycobacterium sp.]
MTEDHLACIDQATFLSLRATGRAQLVWVYTHPVDTERFCASKTRPSPKSPAALTLPASGVAAPSRTFGRAAKGIGGI